MFNNVNKQFLFNKKKYQTVHYSPNYFGHISQLFIWANFERKVIALKIIIQK